MPSSSINIGYTIPLLFCLFSKNTHYAFIIIFTNVEICIPKKEIENCWFDDRFGMKFHWFLKFVVLMLWGIDFCINFLFFLIISIFSITYKHEIRDLGPMFKKLNYDDIKVDLSSIFNEILYLNFLLYGKTKFYKKLLLCN